MRPRRLSESSHILHPSTLPSIRIGMIEVKSPKDLARNTLYIVGSVCKYDIGKRGRNFVVREENAKVGGKKKNYKNESW